MNKEIYVLNRISVVPKAPPHSSLDTGREAMNLKVVSDDRDHPSEASVKVSCRFKTSRTQSRLHLSSKSLPGVLEDVEVLDDPCCGVR